MKKNNNSVFFLILLIVSVAVTIMVCVMNAEKEVSEYQDLKETITVEEKDATDNTSQAVNAFRESTEEEYSNLDEQLDY